jgi:hypothetical protein
MQGRCKDVCKNCRIPPMEAAVPPRMNVATPLTAVVAARKRSAMMKALNSHRSAS